MAKMRAMVVRERGGPRSWRKSGQSSAVPRKCASASRRVRLCHSRCGDRPGPVSGRSIARVPGPEGSESSTRIGEKVHCWRLRRAGPASAVRRFMLLLRPMPARHAFVCGERAQISGVPRDGRLLQPILAPIVHRSRMSVDLDVVESGAAALCGSHTPFKFARHNPAPALGDIGPLFTRRRPRASGNVSIGAAGLSHRRRQPRAGDKEEPRNIVAKRLHLQRSRGRQGAAPRMGGAKAILANRPPTDARRCRRSPAGSGRTGS